MATEKQLQANRANALKSTGPRTPEGKDKSSRNHTTHGFSAHFEVLPGESREEFLDLYHSMLIDNHASGATESALVRQMAAATWRLARLERIENGLIANHMARAWEWDQVSGRRPFDDEDRPNFAGNLSELAQNLGAAWQHDTCGVNSLTTLSRYETPLRRAFFHAMTALHRLQQQRKTLICKEDLDQVIDEKLSFKPNSD